MNSFGQTFRLTTFGESHGPCIGVTVDGCPAGIPLTEDDFESSGASSSPSFGGFGSRFGGASRGSSYGKSSAVTYFKQDRSAAPVRRPVTQAAPVSRPAAAAPAASRYDDATFVPSPMKDFTVGQRIEHNRFGPGRILDITGTFPELKAKIAFDDYPEPKTILLKYAKMRPEQK